VFVAARYFSRKM